MCKRERDPPCPLSLDIYCKQEMLLPRSPEWESQSFPSATAVLGIADSAPHWGSTVEQWTLTNQHVWTKGHTVWLTGTHCNFYGEICCALFCFVLYFLFYVKILFFFGGVGCKGRIQETEMSGIRDAWCKIHKESIKLHKKKKVLDTYLCPAFHGTVRVLA